MSAHLSPVFILSPGGRSGSTLLQRLLISTREIMVWGEHDGALVEAASLLLHRMQAWQGLIDGEQQRRLLSNHGHDAWIPNVTPSIDAFVNGARAMFIESMATEANRLGFARWGFKEIRYDGNAALMLRQLFPQARFVYSIRHPAYALQSLKSTHWYALHCGADPARFGAIWTKSMSSLLQAASQLGPLLMVRYEDLVATPETVLPMLGKQVGIAPEKFDRTVLEKRHRGSDQAPVALSPTELAALASPELVSVAQELGYLLSR